MFPTFKNSRKREKNQKSTDKHTSFDGLIQEDIHLSDIYLAVRITFISIMISHVRIIAIIFKISLVDKAFYNSIRQCIISIIGQR